ncbi:hypothetical protein [Pseudonocardia sp. ICBG1142]|uniref:hypothetical protein n=1 Tax=Pseudonocardia sp. ICBG1142 TaxID=2846760 RepID=UPI001CF693C6|nr:hypothetical protein [Pseudonocardia sp. ICBG1142]
MSSPPPAPPRSRSARPGVATAAEDIHYEKAGTFPDVAACADAGHTTPGVTTWLCDEHPDGTADLYLVPA